MPCPSEIGSRSYKWTWIFKSEKDFIWTLFLYRVSIISLFLFAQITFPSFPASVHIRSWNSMWLFKWTLFGIISNASLLKFFLSAPALVWTTSCPCIFSNKVKFKSLITTKVTLICRLWFEVQDVAYNLIRQSWNSWDIFAFIPKILAFFNKGTYRAVSEILGIMILLCMNRIKTTFDLDKVFLKVKLPFVKKNWVKEGNGFFLVPNHENNAHFCQTILSSTLRVKAAEKYIVVLFKLIRLFFS